MPLMQVSNSCPTEAVWACRSFIISGQLVPFDVRLNEMPEMALARTVTSYVGRVLEKVCFRILPSHLFMCATDRLDVADGWIKANLSAGDCVTSQALH